MPRPLGNRVYASSMTAFRCLCALSIAVSALHAQPALEVNFHRSARSFILLADDQRSVAEAEKRLSADPKNPDLILKLALAQSAVREYREAVATCTRGLAIAPQNADLLIERGHRELGLREFTRARADLEKASKLDPTKMAAFYHLGLAHYFLGEFAPSADAFRHAVQVAPSTDESASTCFGWVYASLRRANKPDKRRPRRSRKSRPICRTRSPIRSSFSACCDSFRAK